MLDFYQELLCCFLCVVFSFVFAVLFNDQKTMLSLGNFINFAGGVSWEREIMS